MKILNTLVLVGASIGLSFSVFAIPNPASAYCNDNGGYLDLRTTSNGNEYGVCMFMEEDPIGIDGIRVSECEEWSYFHGRCKKWDCLVIRELTDVYDDNQTHLFCANEISN